MKVFHGFDLWKNKRIIRICSSESSSIVSFSFLINGRSFPCKLQNRLWHTFPN